MYKTIGLAITIAMLISSTAFAKTPTQKEICANISNMAKYSMELRQINTPISEPLAISQKYADDGTSSGLKTSEFMDSVIMDAYSQELRYSEQMKEISINEFATKYYLDCME